MPKGIRKVVRPVVKLVVKPIEAKEAKKVEPVEPTVTKSAETHDDFQARFIEAQQKRDAEIKANKPEGASVLPVLPAGQQYFESPEGFIELGEAGKLKIWCQRANGGKGAFINPRR